MTDIERSVAPSILPEKFNLLRQPRTAIGCWRVTLGHDHVDARFVEPGTKEAFAEFAATRKTLGDSPIAFFGHVPAVGDPKRQQRGGGEAALAVIGVLTHDVGLWVSAFSSGEGSRGLLQDRLAAAGFPVEDERGKIGGSTKAQVAAYFESLYPFKPLGSDEITIVRSCSGFNPVLLTSAGSSESPTGESKRDLEKFNRRVVAVFLEPGTEGADWPCPEPGDGVGACKARFWSDRDKRHKLASKPRLYRPPWTDVEAPKPFLADGATMGCRFYERLIFGLGCEVGTPEVVKRPPPPPPPKPPKKKPKDWELVIRCDHGRVNRDHLGMTDDGDDRIEIVPPPSGDPVLVYISPETAGEDVQLSTTTEGLIFDDPTVDLGTGAHQHKLFPEHEEPAVENPFWVLGRYSTVAPSFVVTAEKGGETQEVRGVVYPSWQWVVDGSELLTKLSAVVNEITGLIKQAVEVLGEDVKLVVLPEECTARIQMGWKEYPPPPDAFHYLAFFAYDIAVGLNPLIEAAGKFEMSFLQLLRMIEKSSPAGVALGALLDALPDWVNEILTVAKASLKAEASGGGDIKVGRNNPTEALQDFGWREHENKTEVAGLLKAGVDARIDDMKLVERLPWLPGVEISIEGEVEISLLVGLFLRFAAEEMGFYFRARIPGLRVAATFDIPFMDPRTYEAEMEGNGTVGREVYFWGKPETEEPTEG